MFVSVVYVGDVFDSVVECKDIAVSEQGDLLFIDQGDIVFRQVARGQWIEWQVTDG